MQRTASYLNVIRFSRLQIALGFHNASVAGSSPAVATIQNNDLGPSGPFSFLAHATPRVNARSFSNFAMPLEGVRFFV